MPGFKEQTGLSIEAAVEVLFGEALPTVPELTTDQIETANRRMSASSGGAPVHRVTEEEARARFLGNADRSWEFSVEVCDEEAYRGEEAAQLWAWFDLVKPGTSDPGDLQTRFAGWIFQLAPSPASRLRARLSDLDDAELAD